MSELQKLQLVLLIILASSVTVHGFELFICTPLFMDSACNSDSVRHYGLHPF